ncbi:MAG: gas vesicle protein GvpD P-loop domain-containing protein [Candidatus Jordarchaeaceae archaeon]
MVILATNIPSEIERAFNSRTFSLHIKGSAGTGKTILALELGKRFLDGGVVIYLSARVKPEKFYRLFPWCESWIRQENILDVKSNIFPRDKEETLFEYVDKPSFFRSLYSRIVEAGVENITVILDGLEYLKYNVKIPENDYSIECDILEMAEKLNANVIFISETDGEGKLDYLVDGIVRLEKEFIDGQILRKLYIEKIRGVRIENSVYLFTLKDGRFTCFEKGIQTYPSTADLPKVEKKEGKISTLIPELDNVLRGGFNRVSLNIFDVGDRVGVEHAYFLTPMFFNFIRQGYPVFSMPSKGIYSTDLLRYIPQSVMGKEVFDLLKRYFHVLRPSSFSPPITDTYGNYFFEGIDPDGELNRLKQIITSILNETRSDTPIVSIASDTMEYIYGSKYLLKIVQAWIDQIKQLNGVIIIFQFRHSPLKSLTHLASSYFKVENMYGNLIFYGQSPKTKLYVAGLDISNKYVQTRLTPIE